jgi:hypothetical protein
VNVADRFVAERNHPAVVVPTVVETCDLFNVAGDTVRLAKFSGLGDDARELLEGAEKG